MLGIPNHSRPMMRVETLLLIVTTWVVATANGGWWTALSQGRDWSQPENWLLVVSCFIALVGLHFAVLAPFAFRKIVRPLLTVIVIASAGASYYMHTFSVMLDPTMIRNVLHTDVHESRELVGWSMVAWVSLWSLPALVLIWAVRLERLKPLKALALRSASVFGALVIALLALWPVARDMTSFMRNQREARYLITPGNFLYGLAYNSAGSVKDSRAARETIGAD